MVMRPDHLAYWICEREEIRLKKEAGRPAPWSEDPIFQTTYFCNVRREDDKVTRWIAKNWREGHGDHRNFSSAMSLARMFNLPSHLEFLNSELEWWEDSDSWYYWAERAKKLSIHQRDIGEKLFNGAYLITTCGVKMDKVDYVYRVAQDVWEMNIQGDGYPETLAETHHLLMQVNGLGSFLAAQIVADMKNTAGNPLENAPDWQTWCAHGPGSLKGIRYVEGFEGTSPGEFQHSIAVLWGKVRPLLPADLHNLHMQDFQNCLCEFSKYARVHAGGRSKRKYNGC